MVVVGVIQIVTTVVFIIAWGIFGFIISLVLSSVVSTIIYIHNLRDVIFVSSFKWNPGKSWFRESIPFYLESYLMFFREQGDQLFVATLLGPNAMAVYFIAKKPYDILSSFTISLDQVLTTSLAKLKNQKKLFNERVSNIITLNSYILFPLVLIAIGVCPTGILLIAGKGYEAAVVPSAILLLWLIVQLSWRTALGKPIFILKSSSGRFKVTLVETLTLIGFMLVLGHFYGLMGVVIGRLIATVVAGVYAYSLIKNDVSINIDIKSIATITANGMVVCALLLLVQYTSANYLLIGVSFIASIALYLFLINRTVSDTYYSVLNSVSPFKIKDPFSYLIKKSRSSAI